jgi:hypothetical protein
LERRQLLDANDAAVCKTAAWLATSVSVATALLRKFILRSCVKNIHGLSRIIHPAWQYFRAGGEIDGINAGAKRMLGLGNSHRRGPPEKTATPYPSA